MFHGKAVASVGLSVWIATAVLSGQQPEFNKGQQPEFNRDIRPVLSDRCFACHGPDAAKRKTKLRFDTEAGARIQLAPGRFAIVPFAPDQSELVRRVASLDTALRYCGPAMPRHA
jgi:hypothetical protein